MKYTENEITSAIRPLRLGNLARDGVWLADIEGARPNAERHVAPNWTDRIPDQAVDVLVGDNVHRDLAFVGKDAEYSGVTRNRQKRKKVMGGAMIERHAYTCFKWGSVALVVATYAVEIIRVAA